MKSVPVISTIFCFLFVSAHQAQSAPVRDEDEVCSQPGRIESARQLIAQSEKFKLKASQYHLNANESVQDAKKLKGQADKLRAMSGSVDANAPKEYKAALQAFKDHATQYKAHLDKVELQLGHCQESEREYQAQLKDFTLHTEQFHVPNIKPPHICGRMEVSQAEASHMASRLRQDQLRLVSSEAALANSESKLENAMKDSMHSDGALYHRSQLAEEERKLAGEFAGLKTEYELLNTQHNALVGTTGSVSSKSVQGKVKN